MGESVTYDSRRLAGVSVYRKAVHEFSIGDRIQFTALDKTLGVANRDLAVIESISPDGRITARLDNNRQSRATSTSKSGRRIRSGKNSATGRSTRRAGTQPRPSLPKAARRAKSSACAPIPNARCIIRRDSSRRRRSPSPRDPQPNSNSAEPAKTAPHFLWSADPFGRRSSAGRS